MDKILMFVLFFMSIVAHEVAHGWAALQLGDATAKYKGRLTFNPISHIDPFFTILLPLAVFVMSGFNFIFGGAKPVPINPFNFRKPDRDMMLTSLAGPLTNIMLGLFFSLVLLVTVRGMKIKNGAEILLFTAYINFFLAMFNLIPIPPLDGSRVVRYFMPDQIKAGMDRMERWGMLIVFVIIFSPLGDYIFTFFRYVQNAYFEFLLSG